MLSIWVGVRREGSVAPGRQRGDPSGGGGTLGSLRGPAWERPGGRAQSQIGRSGRDSLPPPPDGGGVGELGWGEKGGGGWGGVVN